MTFTMPAKTVGAFYFYAVPRNLPFQTPPCPSLEMTATAQAGTATTSGTVSVNECSAQYLRFYTGGVLTSIRVDSSMDFAVGQFGFAGVLPRK